MKIFIYTLLVLLGLGVSTINILSNTTSFLTYFNIFMSGINFTVLVIYITESEGR